MKKTAPEKWKIYEQVKEKYDRIVDTAFFLFRISSCSLPGLPAGGVGRTV